jgi:beta-phosphoglucomutase
MDALIFDFDGVIVDSEPVHMAGFAQVVEPLGITFTEDEYRAHYLGLDDYEGLAVMARNHEVTLSDEQVADLVARKTAYLQRHLAESIQPIAGAVELIRFAAQADLPLGVCSGALRKEIDVGLRAMGVADLFAVTVAAEEVERGKPHAEPYDKARRALESAVGRPLAAQRCLAVEDSPTGIASARAAGMTVLGLATNYPPADLAEAHRVETTLAGLSLDDLRVIIG